MKEIPIIMMLMVMLKMPLVIEMSDVKNNIFNW